MDAVDFTILNEFKELMGEEGAEEVKDLVNLYLVDGPEQLKTLVSSLATGNIETFQRAAHSFKSSCANIGALNLQQLCLQMEEKAIGENLDAGCETLLKQAQSQFADVQQALTNYLNG